MFRRLKVPWGITAATALLLAIASTLYLRPTRAPPTLFIEFQGYTNRVGPFACLAITNSTESPMTLSGQCLVNYSPTDGPRQRVSIDANPTTTVRLLPNQGFVQEVFVFPSREQVWQFEITAAYSSSWLEMGESIERLLRKGFPSVRTPLTGRFYHPITTVWRPSPD